VVFTFAQTKLEWYILPAFPAFAIAISSFLYQLSKKIQQLSKKNTTFRTLTSSKSPKAVEIAKSSGKQR
jgi:hypothetical protein